MRPRMVRATLASLRAASNIGSNIGKSSPVHPEDSAAERPQVACSPGAAIAAHRGYIALVQTAIQFADGPPNESTRR